MTAAVRTLDERALAAGGGTGAGPAAGATAEGVLPRLKFWLLRFAGRESEAEASRLRLQALRTSLSWLGTGTRLRVAVFCPGRGIIKGLLAGWSKRCGYFCGRGRAAIQRHNMGSGDKGQWLSSFLLRDLAALFCYPYFEFHDAGISLLGSMFVYGMTQARIQIRMGIGMQIKAKVNFGEDLGDRSWDPGLDFQDVYVR